MIRESRKIGDDESQGDGMKAGRKEAGVETVRTCS